MSEIGKSFVNSFGIFKDTVKVLFKYPSLFIPVILNVALFTVIVYYLMYYVNYAELITLPQRLLFGISVVVTLCFVISFCCFFMLEIMQQIETGKKTNLFSAIYEVVFKDVPRALPIMLVWAIIWFILFVIDILVSSVNNRGGITKYNRRIKAASAALRLIQSGVGMLVFYVYPAIAWEDRTPIESVKKAFGHLEVLGKEFLIGFGGIDIILICLLFIPLIVTYFAVEVFNVTITTTITPKTFLFILLGYMSFAYSIYIFLQQTYVAILYLWIIKWQKEMVNAVVNKLPIPEIKDVEIPSLVDGACDLNHFNKR